MNIPLSTAAPSTNEALKEEIVSANASSEATSSGTIKTSSGDIPVSMMNFEETSPVSSNVLDVVLPQIFANEQLRATPNLFQHSLIFLPPETVDLEIQISELMQLLDSEGGIEGASTEESLKHLTKERAPLSQSASPFPRATPSKPLACSTSTRMQSGQEKAFVPKSKDASPQKTSSQLQRSISTLHESASETAALSQQAAKEREASHLAMLPSAFCHENEDKLILTTKTQEFYNEDREGGDQRREGRPQDEQENHSDDENTQKAQGKVDKVKQAPLQTLSLASLRYQYETRPMKETEKVESSVFKKKAQSPMALFGESPMQSQAYVPIQTPKIENVFVRFMRLMARILGQAEAEAHELYLRVKERTDNIDTLTLLISKINSEKKDIDWNKNEEMKALINQAQKLGVSISLEKGYVWTIEEKKLLKENIQMRKENMEKITQLERTDMQRHLQEVSQCHQARSNVLKLLKELMDTFIYNLRP